MGEQKKNHYAGKSDFLLHFSKLLLIATILVGLTGNITAPESAFGEKSVLYIISDRLLGVITLAQVILLMVGSIIYLISLFSDNRDIKNCSKKMIYNLLLGLMIAVISYSLMVRIETFPVGHS